MDTRAASRPPRWTTRLWLAVTLLLIAVVGLRLLLLSGSAPTPLPVMGKVPPFSLVDQNSQSFSSSRLEGRAWLASFIYTTCPGPCPLIVKRIAEIDRRLSHDPRFTIVSFSVDPRTDTPEVLSRYASNHGIQAPHWRLLTGDADQLYALIRKGFLLGVERSQDSPQAAPSEGAVMHSTRVVLLDGQMHVRGYYDSSDTSAMSKLVADTTRLMDIDKP